MIAADWHIWQLCDSAFPTGGFAHSGGVEGTWQYGAIPDAENLRDFLHTALIQTALCALPFVFGVYEKPDDFDAIDLHCDAFLSNQVANRASRLQGRAFLASATRIFMWELPGDLTTANNDALLPRHLAPVSGFIFQKLQLPREQARRMYLFITLRGLVSSAVRLGIVGPLQAQQIQASMNEFLDNAVLPLHNLPPEHAVQSAPLMEIFQGGQDRLYSRLFQS